MKYCKVLSLALALSTALAYGMGSIEQGFKRHIIKIDPSAQKFSANEWEDIIVNILEPMIELAKESGKDLTEVVGDSIASGELKEEYFSYRIYVLLKGTKKALRELEPKLEKEADLIAKGKKTRKEAEQYAKWERGLREREILTNQFVERYGYKPRSDEELREFEEQLLKEEEEAFRKEFESTPKRHERAAFERGQEILRELDAKKKEASRLKKERKEAQEAAATQEELLEKGRKYNDALEKIAELTSEHESLGKSKEELEQELREKERLLEEANRALEIIKRSQMTEEEVKSEEQEKLKLQVKNDLYAAQEKVAEAEGEVAGVSKALAVITADSLRNIYIKRIYEAVKQNYTTVERGLRKANEEIVDWFNEEQPNIKVLMSSLKDILENKEYIRAANALYDQFKAAYTLPDEDAKWDELIENYRRELEYLVNLLKVIENEFLELTKLPVKSPGTADKNKYNGFTRLRNYLSGVNYGKLRPEEGGTHWSTGEYLYGALARLTKMLKLPRY